MEKLADSQPFKGYQNIVLEGFDPVSAGGFTQAGMQNELSGSAFFGPRQSVPSAAANPAKQSTTQPANRESVGLRAHETAVARDDAGLVETVRKAVRQLGKEESSYRFTAEEKQALADIVYTYGAAGIRTTQNEITRIGINSLVEDYRRNGEQSLLARVIERLNQ